MPMPTPELQREYGREWYNARRRAFFADKVCEECGATDELRLHHRVPAEKRKRAYRLRNGSTVHVRAEEAGDSIVHSATHSSGTAA